MYYMYLISFVLLFIMRVNIRRKLVGLKVINTRVLMEQI